MGVNGLLKALKPISQHKHISEYKGAVCAIDASSWLHKGSILDAFGEMEGKSTNEAIYFCLQKIDLLKHYQIIPVMIFDGAPMKAKMGERNERTEARKAAYTRMLKCLEDGNYEEAYRYSKRSIQIKPTLVFQLIKELNKRNLLYLVAPYEADAQLSYYSRESLVDIVLTEDSDTLPYGCKKVVFKLQTNGECIEINNKDLPYAGLLPPPIFSDDTFQLMCVLAGCDYSKNLNGIGIKRAADLVCRHNTHIYNIMTELEDKYDVCIPPNYTEQIRVALLTYKHQTVFNRELKTVELTSPPIEITHADREMLGPLLDDKTAFMVAYGIVNPHNYEIYEGNFVPVYDTLLPHKLATIEHL